MTWSTLCRVQPRTIGNIITLCSVGKTNDLRKTECFCLRESLCKLLKVHSSFTAITRGRGEERGSSRYAVKGEKNKYVRN